MQSLIAEFLTRCPENLLSQLGSSEFLSYEKSIRQVAPFYSADDIKFRFLRNLTAHKLAFENVMDQIVRERGFVVENLITQLWMTDLDLKTLTEKGHAIGLHSFDHPYEIARLTYEKQKEQYKKNYEHILAASRQRPVSVAHPLNSYNQDSLAILKELGIQCGFRANTAAGFSKAVNPSPLEWAREDSANLLQMIA